MKKALFILLLVFSAITIQSCGIFKSTLSSAPERYVASYENKVIEIEDKNGYIQHAESLGLQEIELELIKGILFKPMASFTSEESASETTAEKTVITLPLSKIKGYSRILH